MFAPLGVDSDSSGEEDDSSPSPPSPTPKPGLFKTLLTPTHKLNEQQAKEDIKKLTPVQAAEKLTPRPPTPPRGKKVRIHLEGEEHPDKVDLVKSPVPESPGSPTSSTETMEEISTGALSPLESGKRPEEVAGEVLALLQKILAEAAARPPSPPYLPAATLTPFQQYPPQENQPNALGLANNGQSTASHASPGQGGKKPSKLFKWTKLAMQVANPSSSNDSSPTSHESTVPPYSSPVQQSSQQETTTPPVLAQQHSIDPQYFPLQPSSTAYPTQYGPSSAQAPIPQQGPPPTTHYQPPHTHSYDSPPPVSHYSAPAFPTDAFANQQYYQYPQFDPAQQYPSHSGYEGPHVHGQATDYYSGNVYASQPYPQHIAETQAQPASAPPHQSASHDGSGPNRLTDYPSRWRPGELHWTFPEGGAGGSRADQRRPPHPSAHARDHPNVETGTSRHSPYEPPAATDFTYGQTSVENLTAGSVLSAPPTTDTPPPLSSAPPWLAHHPPHPARTAYYPPPTAPAWYAYQPRAYPPYPPYAPYGPYSPLYPSHPALPPPSTASTYTPAQYTLTSPDRSPLAHAPQRSRALMAFPIPEHYIRRHGVLSATSTPAASGRPALSSQSAASLTSTPSAYSETSASAGVISTSGFSPNGTQSTTYPLSSTRIVKQRQDGTFHPVDPYPEAQALLSPLTRSRGPPPNYISKDEATSPLQVSAPPRKVRKEDMSHEKRQEYEAVMREREKRRKTEREERVRVKVAEGSLSPKEVQVAVEKAAEAREEDGRRARLTTKQSVEGETDRKSHGEEGKEKMEEEEDKIKRLQERVMSKLKKGEITKDEAKTMLKEHETTGGAIPDIPSSAKSPAPEGGTITPTGRGFAEVEKKLEKTKYRIKRLKAKVTEGRMSQEKAKAEMGKLTERQRKLMLELPGPSSPAANKAKPEAKRHRPTEGTKEIPGRVRLDSTEDPVVDGKGKAKATEMPDGRQPVGKDASQVTGIPKASDTHAARTELELKERMKRIRQKVVDGKMDKDEAKKELVRLEEKRLKLQPDTPLTGGKTPVTKSESRAVIRPPPGDSAADTVVSATATLGAEPADSGSGSENMVQAKQQLDELKARMKRVQAKVAEGKMGQTEGEEELKRLQTKREKLTMMLGTEKGGLAALNAGTDGKKYRKADLSDPNTHKAKTTESLDELKQDGSETATLTSAADAPKSADGAQHGRAGVKEQMAEIERRTRRIREKAAGGKMDKSVAEAELKRLAEKQKSLRSTLAEQNASKRQDGDLDIVDSAEGVNADKPSASLSDTVPTPAHQQDKDRELPVELADIRMRMQRIKVRVADGRMSKEEGTAEMKKLNEKEQEVELAGRREYDSAKKATEEPYKAKDKSTTQDDAEDPGGKLAEVRARMQRIKMKVSEGRMSKEEGKVEMAKLRQKEQEREFASSPEFPAASNIAHEPSQTQTPKESTLSNDPTDTAQLLAELRLRMQRVKVKGTDGRMSKEEGQTEMANSKVREKEYETARRSDRHANAKATETSSDPPKERTPIADQGETEKKLANVRARMQKVKTEVGEGKISKEEAKAEMEKLKQIEEGLRATSSRKPPTPDSNDEAVVGATPAQDWAGGRSTGFVARETGDKPSMRLPELDEQIERVKRKVKDGTLDPKKGKAKLVELTALRRRFDEPTPVSPHDKSVHQSSKAERVEIGLALQDQVAKVKQKLKDGKMSQDEGKVALANLATKPKKLNEKPQNTLSSNGGSLGSSSAAGGVRGRDKAPETDGKTDKLEEKLEENKRKIVHLQKKVLSALEADRASIEKALKELAMERKELKKALSALKTPEPPRRAPDETHEREELQPREEQIFAVQASSREELDPEILQEILAFDLPGAQRPSPSETLPPLAPESYVARPDPASPEAHRDGPRDSDSPTPPHVPGSYPWAEQSAKRANDTTGDGLPPTAAALPQVAFPVPRPVQALDAGQIAPQDGSDRLPDRSYPATPETTPMESAVAISDKREESGESGSPGVSMDHQAQSLSVGHTTWSTCLVSLAECINLANHLLAQLAAKHEMTRTKDGESFSLYEHLIPRLLTAVLLQQDLDGVLRKVFGDDSADSVREFTRHLHQVKGYLSSVDFAALTPGQVSRSNDGIAHGILSVTDHLLRLSQYLSPDMMSSLRKLLHEWKEDGLTLHNILLTIQFVKNDLMISGTQAEQDEEAVKGDTKAGVLQQLLDLLDNQVSHTAREAKNHNRRRSHGLSLTAQQPEPIPSRSPSPLQESPRGVRERISSMIHILRASPTHPIHLSSTAPLDVLDTGQSPPWSHPVALSQTNRHDHRPGEARHEVAPSTGLTILTESLSPTSKRRVAHHLLRPSEVVHQEHHQPHSAPHLHLPPATADFLEAPGPTAN